MWDCNFCTKRGVVPRHPPSSPPVLNKYRFCPLPPVRRKPFSGPARTLAGTAMLMRGNSAFVLVSIMLHEMSPSRSPAHLNKAPPLAPDWMQQVVCSMATGSDTWATMPRVTVGWTLSSSEKSEKPAAITGSPGGFIRRYENKVLIALLCRQRVRPLSRGYQAERAVADFYLNRKGVKMT